MRGKKVIYYRLSNDIDVIGSIGGSKNYNDPTAKADAERIVKAVNLLSLIEKQIEINKAFGNEEKSKVILAEAIEKIINQH